MNIDQLIDGSVAVSAAEKISVTGFDHQVPLFEFACDAAAMPRALDETRRWMDRYTVIQKGRFHDVDDIDERRRRMEEQLREFDNLLKSKPEFILLQPNVRDALNKERTELKEEIELL